ncbi:MAG TPA: glutamyl-tRNA reductase [Thermoleophilaceae bacterium]|nr:glutamyl-tRNA reductase [Thermoleophilaceae bacterium]
MSGELLALGVSHKTAPLELRERLALTEGRATAVLAELTAHEEIHEAVSISTCNRTELYLVSTDPVAAESAALAVLARQAETRPTELADSLYALRDLDVARHLFSVVAGLDSMIVGEAEIQGQVKRAYELALVGGTTGPIVNRLFRDALAAGKRVRTETGVGRSRVSVASVAADLACRGLSVGPADAACRAEADADAPPISATNSLSDRRLLVIGAGEQGERVARALKERGAHAVFVANRRYDRAIGLAERYSGTAVPLDELPAELALADIVVSCTASPHQLVGREELALVLEGRANQPLVVIDIAVPRDIDPSVRDLPGVTLYDMDDLEQEVARNISGREAEAERARELIENEVERFEVWLASLEVLPTIRGLRERADAIVEQVLAENAPRWESLSDADRERVAALSRALVARLFHEPTMRLRDSAENESSYMRVAVLRELFGLDAALAPLEGEQPEAEVTELDSRRRRRG